MSSLGSDLSRKMELYVNQDGSPLSLVGLNESPGWTRGQCLATVTDQKDGFSKTTVYSSPFIYADGVGGSIDTDDRQIDDGKFPEHQ